MGGAAGHKSDEVDDVIEEMIEIDRPVIADIWVDQTEKLFPDDSVGRCTQRDAARPGRRGIKTCLRRRHGAGLARPAMAHVRNSV